MGINELNFFTYYVIFYYYYYYYYYYHYYYNYYYYLMNSNKGSLSCRWHSRLHKNNDEGRGVRRFVALLVVTCPIFW